MTGRPRLAFYGYMPKAVSLVAILLPHLALTQSPRMGPPLVDSVLVSRRSLVISSPINDSTPAVTGRAQNSGANVRLIVDLRRLSSWLQLSVVTPVNQPAYSFGRRPLTCRVLTDTYSCRDSTTVEIANGRLVITVRDSAMLALLFDGRPTQVMVQSDAGYAGLARPIVRYVDPQLLAPSMAALVEYDRALGRDGWGPWTRMMWTSSFGALDTVWMQVGDRVTASLGEMQCRPIDSCNSRSDFSASAWTSTDSSTTRVEASNETGRVSATIVAIRPGRSTVAVEGLHGPSDDLPRSTHIRTIARHIVVTNRLTRLQITPRPMTIIAGSSFRPEAQLIDDTGTIVTDAPVNFLVIYDWPDNKDWGSKRYDLATRADLTTPGHRRFIAYFGKLADTLDTQVLPRTPRSSFHDMRRLLHSVPATSQLPVRRVSRPSAAELSVRSRTRPH